MAFVRNVGSAIPLGSALEGWRRARWSRYDQSIHHPYPQKITFGEVRASGTRDVLIYCRDHRCSHHIAISADRWPDHVQLSDIEPVFTCSACGKRGTEVRPKFSGAG